MSTLEVGNASGGGGASGSSGVELTPEQQAALTRDFIVVNRQSAVGETTRDKVGNVADWNSLSGFLNRVSCVKKEGSDILVANYYDKPCILTPSEHGTWSVKRELPITYQNPTAANSGIAYVRGMALDTANNRVAMCSWARQIVRQYDLSGNLQFTIGIPSSAGNQADGKLYYPSNAFYLPTGELAIVSYYGKGADCNNHGHISLYDPDDGSFIGTRAGCTEDVGTVIETGGIYRPIDAVINGNLMYVSVYGRSKIAVLDMSTTNEFGLWPVVDIILLPGGARYASSNSTAAELWGITLLSDGKLVISSRRNSELYCVDPATHEHIWTINLIDAGYQADCHRVCELEPGYLVLSNFNNSIVQVVPTPAAIVEQYDIPIIPSGWEVFHAPDNFDVTTGTLSLSSARDRSPEKITIAIRES